MRQVWVVVTVLLSSIVPASVPIQTIFSVAPPTLRDVTYCIAGGMNLKMDVYLPKTDALVDRPAVVYVHGGGWTSGDKSGGAGIADIPELLSRGFVVVSLNYRLAPEYKFPAQIEDVKCAIRSLKTSASEYHIDAGKIGAWGGSVGGHLVSLLGLTNSSAGFDVGQYLDKSSRVQAVVDYFGPSNLTAPDLLNVDGQVVKAVFGSADALKSASPVTYITQDDPPFLIVQGEQDTTVPPSQSQELYDRLTAAGVSARLLMVANAGHGFTPVGGPTDPSRDEITKAMANFFETHLRGSINTNTINTSTDHSTSSQPPLNRSIPGFPVEAIGIGLALGLMIIVFKQTGKRVRNPDYSKNVTGFLIRGRETETYLWG